MPVSSIKASSDDVWAYTGLMPAPVRARAEALFAELEGYRADVAILQARRDAHAELMREAKAEPKKALVSRFIDQHRAALLATPPRFRCGFLRGRMQQAQLRGEVFDIPSDKFLRKCLKQSGFLTKNDPTPKG